MSTIKDVAQKAQVSVATVSRVINNAACVTESTRIKVQQAIDTLNYYPDANARSLSQQASNTIGIVVGDVSDIFFGYMVKIVDQVAKKFNYFLLIGNGYHDEAQERAAISKLIEHRCQVLLVHAKKLSDDELAKFMLQIPGMILINRILVGFEDRCVCLDDGHGSYLATMHLLKNGHSNIGYLCSDHKISDSQDRLNGYKKALLEYGIAFDEHNVAYGEPNEQGGEIAMRTLFERNCKMTAIASYNDAMAVGAMSVIYENDFQIPQDISVVGFDDLIISKYLYPKLTTVHYPLKSMAEQATLLSLSLVNNLPYQHTRQNLFTPTLIKRNSVINRNK